MTHYLGIDIGTSGCRACVIGAAGVIQAEARASLPAPVQQAGTSEQDAGLWWRALCQLLDRLAATTQLTDVAAIAIDGTSGTLLCCDSDGTPLAPALMYNDARATAEATRIAATAPADSGAHGASSGLAKLLYLQTSGLTANASRVLHQADWLLGRLAGRFDTTDENNALKLGYDPVSRCWPGWLDELGVDRAVLPEVVPPGQTIGTLDAALCERWGLDPATRIVSGTTDSTAAFLATGAAPGEAVSSLGSTLVLKIHTDTPVFDPRYGIYSHRLGDHWLVGGASNTGGAVLQKYFSKPEIDALSARLQPDTPTGLDYYPLPSTGERFPENNPQLAPRLEPRPVDDAVFFQGILEGIAAIEQRGYRLLEQLGAPYPARVHSIGGGARNDAWREIREAALGVPVVVAEHQQAAYGTALLARQGLNQDRQTGKFK
ncbi:MAG: FGGY-family carbohydrate kinase [Pseudomonadota bacterium]